MTLHIIPIEPIEKRYSAQWLTWFDQQLTQFNCDYELNLYEPLHYLQTQRTCSIKQGEFLDVIETNCYKAKQLQTLMKMFECKKIKSGDTILLLDGWFPGIEAVAYVRDALGLNIKIVAMLHAGTYDPHDFLTQKGMEKWGEHVENGWLEIYDKIIVATHYHKQLLVEQRIVKADKIKVIFFPMLTDWLKVQIVKKDTILFPHRHAPEKIQNYLMTYDSVSIQNQPYL